MRQTTTAALMAALMASAAAPALAQAPVPPIGPNIGGELIQLFRGTSITGSFDTFPEDVTAEQYKVGEALYENFLEEDLGGDPILTPDLPSPYNTSLRNLPGYYRVTLTQPTLD